MQIRINGVKASQEEFIAVPAKDIVRIEVIDNPGMKYGEGDMGTVVDVIVRRQETGGLVNVSNSFCPYRIMMFPNGSIKLNHKKSQWGFYYDGFLRDSKKAWTDKDEVFTIGDRTIHRIQEGQYGRNKVFMHNFSLTYNLYNPDDYTLNIAFRNALTNSPYGDINSKLYDAGSPDYILAQTKNDRQSYTPSLDIYFKKQFKHNQEFQANIVGTLINSESYRRYGEYRDQVQLADIETDVDANKKSIWGEAIYGKTFKNIVLSAGARHYQMYAHNEYRSNYFPTVSSMHQANSSVFMDLQGKVKGVGYLLSLGGTRSYFEEGATNHAYYTFTPKLRVNFTPHKNGWMQYSFSVTPNIPSLSSLTNVEQMIDTIQIQRGNPDLQTYRSYENKLIYTYNRNHFFMYLLVQHQYSDNPIMEEYFVENGKLICTEENQKYLQMAEFFSNLMLRNIKWNNWSWNAGLTIGIARHWSKGNFYNHTHNVLLVGGSTSLYYKEFGFSTYFRKGGGILSGETVLKAENLFHCGFEYTHKNLQVSAGIRYPFGGYKNGSERISKIAKVILWNYIRDAERQLSLSVRYRFEFGNKFKDRNRQAGYNDKDSGVLKY